MVEFNASFIDNERTALMRLTKEEKAVLDNALTLITHSYESSQIEVTAFLIGHLVDDEDMDDPVALACLYFADETYEQFRHAINLGSLALYVRTLEFEGKTGLAAVQDLYREYLSDEAAL